MTTLQKAPNIGNRQRGHIVPFAGRFAQSVPEYPESHFGYSERTQTSKGKLKVLLQPMYASNTRFSTNGGDQDGNESN